MGKLRVGAFPRSPLSMVRDSKTGEMHGLCIDLGKELAKRLDVAFEQVSYEPSQKPPGSVIQLPLLTLIALATNF
jgi:ABC-type amino acid transport substrate-binding protein